MVESHQLRAAILSPDGSTPKALAEGIHDNRKVNHGRRLKGLGHQKARKTFGLSTGTRSPTRVESQTQIQGSMPRSSHSNFNHQEEMESAVARAEGRKGRRIVAKQQPRRRYGWCVGLCPDKRERRPCPVHPAPPVSLPAASLPQKNGMDAVFRSNRKAAEKSRRPYLYLCKLRFRR